MNDDLEKLETHEHVVRLSVIIPCYNEEKTLETCFNGEAHPPRSDVSLRLWILLFAGTSIHFEVDTGRQCDIGVLWREPGSLRSPFKPFSALKGDDI